MHYRLLVTCDKDHADNSEEARDFVFDTMLEDGSFFGGRFCCGIGDWFVVGGRWSGELSRATWAKAVQEKINALEKERGLSIRGTYYGTEEMRTKQAELKAKVEALYQEALPEAYRDKGLVYDRNTYQDHGYEDDAMLIDETLYEAFLVPFEGDDMVSDMYLMFVDLDYDAASREFIGKKWIVVVDVHT